MNPIHTAPRLRRVLMLAGLTVLSLALLAACDASDASEDDPLGLGSSGSSGSSELSESPPGSGGAATIDQSAILGDATEVRALLSNAASNFDPNVVEDVDYSGNSLAVTVTEDVQGLEDAQALCDDLSEAIQVVELTIVVRNATGAELAACTFEG